MTNIEKIKQARQEMDTAFEVAFSRASRVNRNLRVRMIDMEVLQRSVHNLMALQAEAIRQATEVADENFARAQKLSEHVQENVRHIERLAERRSDEDKQIFANLVKSESVLGYYVDHQRDMPLVDVQDLQANLVSAIALAKGEAV